MRKLTSRDKITKEDYNSIKKAFFEAMSEDLDGTKLFDAKKMDETFKIKFSLSGKPLSFITKKNNKVEQYKTKVSSANDDEYDSTGEIWGCNIGGTIMFDDGRVVPIYSSLNDEADYLKPIEETNYGGYSTIYNDNNDY